MLWCDIWEWILYLWNAKNYLQTLETFLEKYLKLFKNKVVLQVINHQSDLLKKKIVNYFVQHKSLSIIKLFVKDLLELGWEW